MPHSRYVALALVAGLALLWPSVAHADPIITPIITSLLVGGGLSISAAGVVAPILSGIITTGLGMLLSALFTPDPPKPDNGSFAIQQAIPPRQWGMGRARTAGFVALCEEYAESLYYVAALGGQQIIGFVSHYLNDDQITIGVDGFVEEGEDGRYGDETVWLDTRLGLPTETAYDRIVDEMPSWTTDHRGDQVASLAMVCRDIGPVNFPKRFPYNRPQPSAVIDWTVVFDPRDPAQEWDDPETWSAVGYDNPILQLLFFECFHPGGAHRDYETAILPIVDVWKGEADICDELVPLKAGGTEKRYIAGGTWNAEQDNRTTRKAILVACDGWTIQRGDGTLMVRAGKYREPDVVITDDDIFGAYIQDDMPDEDRFEFAKATYTSPDNGYVSVDTDPVALDNGALAIDKQRTQTIPLTWCQSTGQASRLLRREITRYHEPVRGTLNLHLTAINALYDRWVRVESSLPLLNGRVIENKRSVLRIMTGGCELEFLGSGPHVDTYDAASMESTAPPVPTRPETVGPPIPANVAVVAEQTRGTDDKATVRLVVSWDAPVINGEERNTFRWVVRWRIQGSGASGWTESSFARLPISASRITAKTGPVPPSQDLDVEVASSLTRGTLSQWSTTETISTAIDGLAPPPPTNFTATGGATVDLECKAPDSYIFKAVQFFRGSTSDDFEDSAPIGQKVKGNPKQTLDYEDTPSAGTYRYWVVAISDDGVSSTPVGPETATAT